MAGLYYGNVSFGSGLVYGLKILFVTAVGGYLSPPRAALGAAAFGMAESLWAGYFPIEWRDAWMYLFLVAMLVLIGAGRDQQQDRLNAASDFGCMTPQPAALVIRLPPVTTIVYRCPIRVDPPGHARHTVGPQRRDGK